jgi:hypothetical protein
VYLLGNKGGRCVELTTLPPSCADCLEIWEPQPPGTVKACPGPYRGSVTLALPARLQGITTRKDAIAFEGQSGNTIPLNFQAVNLKALDRQLVGIESCTRRKLFLCLMARL